MNLSKKMGFAQLFFFFVFTVSYGQSDLLIFPKRLEFDGSKERVKILRLSNIGKDTATYRISYKEKVMREDGGLEVIEDVSKVEKPASPYLRFYPRSVTLAPNETQVLKIQLVKTNGLETGEYRSHLDLRSIPKKSLRTGEDISKQNKGLGFNIQPIYGIAIANIIRIGKVDAHTSFSDLRFEYFQGTIPVLHFVINRSGDASSYGELRVLYKPNKGEEIEVGKVRGFAVYTSVNKRNARMELQKVEGVNFTEGQLKILYTAEGNRKEIYAETTVEL